MLLLLVLFAFLLLLSCQCCYIVDSVTFSALSLVAAVAIAAPAEVRRFQANKPYAAGLQKVEPVDRKPNGCL